MPKRAYADTSVLVSLHVQDANSRAAIMRLKKTTLALCLTPFGRHELRNAIRLCVFRRQITSQQRDAALTHLEEDLHNGVLTLTPVNWAAVLQLAETLSAKHTEALGMRAMDILHVASALSLEVAEFITFDERQAQLATAAGLSMEI